MRENITYEIIMQDNQISHVFRNFQSSANDTNRSSEHGVLFQSFSEASKCRGREGVNRNGTPKSTTSTVKKQSLKKYFWNGRMVGKQKSSTTSGPPVPVLEPFVFTTGKS